MKKQVSKAFGKQVYLLGADKQGDWYWLEAPSWDCNWYWGFGYIEHYTNNKRPDMARDIESHEHADNFMSEWFTEWNGSKPRLTDSTFTKQEGWELSELFEQFYFLQKSAECFAHGKCNVADTIIDKWEKPDLAKEINQDILPKVMQRICDILTPTQND